MIRLQRKSCPGEGVSWGKRKAYMKSNGAVNRNRRIKMEFLLSLLHLRHFFPLSFIIVCDCSWGFSISPWSDAAGRIQRWLRGKNALWEQRMSAELHICRHPADVCSGDPCFLEIKGNEWDSCFKLELILPQMGSWVGQWGPPLDCAASQLCYAVLWCWTEALAWAAMMQQGINQAL